MPRFDLAIVNGDVVGPEATTRANVLVRDGKLAAVSTEPVDSADATRVIDASGLQVLPGLIDTHVHFREPGLTYKEDFSTGSQAAVAGGITTVQDMPNTIPPTSTVDAYQYKRQRAEETSLADFAILGVILEDSLDQIVPLAEAGVSGYKIFMGPTVGGLLPPDDGRIMAALERVASTGKRCAFHAESPGIIHYLEGVFREQGRNDPYVHVDSRPVTSSLEAVGRAGLFAKSTGCPIHIMHESSNEVCDLVKRLRSEGVDITVETGPHYLLFKAEDMERYGVLLKINDPIRYEKDGNRLWDELFRGTINCISTDHSPHLPEEKFSQFGFPPVPPDGDVWKAIPGFPGVETSARLMLNEVNAGRMTLNQYVRFASENPARVWGLYPKKGSLLPGTDGDFTIVDMTKTGAIRAEDLHSRGRYTPFEGMQTRGMPTHTIVRGHVQMEDGKIVGEPIGSHALP